MKINIERCKVLYLGREKVFYSTSVAFLLYLFIWILFFGNSNVRKIILTIIYLIAACTIIMLCRLILIMKNKIYYQFITAMYVCIAIVSMIKLIPIELIDNSLLLALRNEDFLNTVYMQILSIECYYIFDYVSNDMEFNLNNKSVKRDLIILNLIISIFILANCSYTIFVNKGVLIISNIITLSILIFTLKKFKDIKVFIDNKINTIILMDYFIIVITLINLVNCLFSFHEGYIIYLKELLLFQINAFIMVLIVEKLINRPYKLLFNDLYRENLEIDTLNNKVLKKNRELEISQSFVRKREKMFKSFFVNVPVPMVKLAENGRIIFANLGFQKLVEQDSMKDIINKKISKIININNFSSIEQLINDNKEVNGVIKLENEEKYVDIDIVKLAGNAQETLFILNDVTTRVNIDKMKTDIANNRFQERIKRDFLSNISHDLKTPINVIYSASQLVTMFIKKKDKESLLKYNMICKMNCFSLIRLTNNLIDSSKIYSNYLSPDMNVENIVEIVEEVVMSLVDYVKSKNIELVFDTDEEEIYVNIDNEFMQRIIINLISNAIKFTNENGTIQVVIHNEDKEVVISVKDNGIGMENEFIENAFKRYSMGKNNSKCNTKGTGIGLFVVKKLIEKQNGKINIVSDKNKGTNVEIRFNKEI